MGFASQVSAKLKLVRVECIDALIHNTLEHDNLASLCFSPMLKKAWNRNLIREINHSAANTLKRLTVNFRHATSHCTNYSRECNDFLKGGISVVDRCSGSKVARERRILYSFCTAFVNFFTQVAKW